MKLYHFTSPHHIGAVRREGLTLGCIPVIGSDGVGLIPGFQWLTLDPSFEQGWNVRINVKYDRTAWRITVKIPKDHTEHLFRWNEFARRAGFPKDYIEGLAQCGGSENWHIFAGRIPPGWFREVTEKGRIYLPAQLQAEAI